MRTSSKNTSLKPWSPAMLISGRIVMPGASIGTRNMLMPLCFGASRSVRAAIQPQLERWAPVVQIFWPLITKSSPSRTAFVWIAARSEPAAGSE